jgi:hypothetical protein
MILSAAASSAGGLATAYAFASPSSRAPDLASGIPPLRMGSEYEFRCFDDKVGCWCRDAADGVRAVMLYPVRRETHEFSRSRVCAHGLEIGFVPECIWKHESFWCCSGSSSTPVPSQSISQASAYCRLQNGSGPRSSSVTIAPCGGLTVLSNGVCVLADYGMARAPGLDILVVTGGPGWIDQSRAPETLAFIRRQAAAIPIVPVSHGRTDRHSQRHSRRKGGDDRARRRALRTVDARTAAR